MGSKSFWSRINFISLISRIFKVFKNSYENLFISREIVKYDFRLWPNCVKLTFATRYYKKVQLKIAKLPYIGGPDSPDMMVLNVMKLIKF